MSYAFNIFGRIKMLTELWLLVLKERFNLGDLGHKINNGLNWTDQTQNRVQVESLFNLIVGCLFQYRPKWNIS
jgi:hypothetical protein